MTNGERGSALLVVLFILLILEIAVALAALQIHWAASRYRLEHDQLVADRLSEAGIAHAAAVIGPDPAFRGTIEGDLAGGRYQVSVEKDEGGTGFRLTSTGRTVGDRAARLVIELVRRGGRLEVASRERTHFVGAR